MRLCFVRHGRTAWNDAGRIQGQTDIPLSPLGREQVMRWRLPPPFDRAPCLSSPLDRARETAVLLGRAPRIDRRLQEMSWGELEGCTLAQLRAEHGPAFRANEALGLDFRPPGGETPREVAARLRALVGELAETGRDHLLVCHKGVLRASIVLGCGWDMLGEPPVRLLDDHALVHRVTATGGLLLENILDLAAEAR